MEKNKSIIWECYNAESKQKLTEHSTRKYKLKLIDGQIVTATFKEGHFHSILYYKDLDTEKTICEPVIPDEEIIMYSVI